MVLWCWAVDMAMLAVPGELSVWWTDRRTGGFSALYIYRFSTEKILKVILNYCLISREGITQWDSLSMIVCAIHSLQDIGKWTQVFMLMMQFCWWKSKNLYDQFNLLCASGLVFGYFLQPSKCFIVVSPPTGHQFLGGYIGDLQLRHWNRTFCCR